MKTKQPTNSFSAPDSLKEAYAIRTEARELRARKLVETQVLSATKLSEVSTARALSQSILIFETLAESLVMTKKVPALGGSLRTAARMLQESAFKTRDSSVTTKTLLYYAALSEFLREGLTGILDKLPTGDTKKSLREVYGKDVILVMTMALNKTRAAIMEGGFGDGANILVTQLASCSSAELRETARRTPFFPIVLTEEEIVNVISEITGCPANTRVADGLLLEQASDLGALSKAITMLRTVADKISKDMPMTAQGFKSFESRFQSAMAGEFKFLGRNKAAALIAQAYAVVRMFDQLPNVWKNVANGFQSLISQGAPAWADPRNQKLLTSAIAKNIGGGGVLKSLSQKLGVSATFPKELTPMIVATDIFNLLKTEGAVPAAAQPVTENKFMKLGGLIKEDLASVERLIAGLRGPATPAPPAPEALAQATQVIPVQPTPAAAGITGKGKGAQQQQQVNPASRNEAESVLGGALQGMTPEQIQAIDPGALGNAMKQMVLAVLKGGKPDSSAITAAVAGAKKIAPVVTPQTQTAAAPSPGAVPPAASPGVPPMISKRTQRLAAQRGPAGT